MTIKSNTVIDTIIFDLGAVLIDWNPEFLYRKIFDDESEMRYFLKNICTPEWNAQQDAGRKWADAVDLLLPQHPEYENEIRAYWQRWPEMLNGPISGTVEILQEIKKQNKYRLLALTNWSEETWPYAWEQYHFLQWFEGILVSGKEHMKKPDPRIYHLLIERYGIEPERSLFIDDSRANVESAQAVGIQAVHFTSPEQLLVQLQEAAII